METNFKIYAKTDTIESDVYLQILQLFIQKRVYILYCLLLVFISQYDKWNDNKK